MMLHHDPKAVQNVVWWVVTFTACFSAFCGLLWTIWIVRAFRREKRWVVEGRCLKCGYDLRQSKDRCPECGTVILNTKRF